MDGLTLVLRYENGEMVQAITRGRDGIVGEDVTHTVKTFLNVMKVIYDKLQLTLYSLVKTLPLRSEQDKDIHSHLFCST